MVIILAFFGTSLLALGFVLGAWCLLSNLGKMFEPHYLKKSFFERVTDHPTTQLFLDNPVAIIAPGFFFLVLLAILLS